MSDNFNDFTSENTDSEKLNTEQASEQVSEETTLLDSEQEIETPVSEEQKARAMMVDMPNPHGAIIENANGGEGTIVRSAYLGKEMQTSFLEYSMSVIVSRALPDVRDGLKPVHRRILYAMNMAGITPAKPHAKSARTVGDVIGKYHPHGDLAVYDTMVRLAQPFSMRVPLVDGHGNFGSIDGDSAAAMRYTEARLDKAAMELLRDLNKETVDMVPNYDESTYEPSVLPARFPNLIVNGSSGIAVGMATNIPPHNLGETIDATCLLLDNPDATLDEIMEVLPGPDFPTGALIMGKDGIRQAYETGRGSITIRSKTRVEEGKNGKSTIVISEIPYQVNRTNLLKKIADLVRDKKLPEVSNVHDGADRTGIDILIELKSNAIPQVVLNKLFKHTQLQVGFGCNFVALVNGIPQTLPLKACLTEYIKHQVDVITRRTRYDLAKAEARAHILEGYVIALDNIDEVISIIRGSETEEIAKNELCARFKLSIKQSEAILQMRLRRLTGLERSKIEQELQELRELIAYYQKVLGDPAEVRRIIKEELQDIKKRFDTPRRTQLSETEKDIDVEDLIADEEVAITVTKAGYIKRLPITTYRQQKRGGKGMQGVNLKDNDFVEHLFVASTHDYMLFFTSFGKVYRLKAYEVPEASRHARGTAIVNLLQLDKGETVSAVISTKDFPDNEYLLFATEQGMVKKTSMNQYDRTRRDGLIAINLREDDSLITVKRVAPGEDVVMVSSAGKAIRWNSDEIRPMGRDTMGVRGMKLPIESRVLGMEIVKPNSELLVITELGYGKRTDIDEYPLHHRGGQGVFTISMTKKKGFLAGMRIVNNEDELMIITESGVVVRTPVSGISKLGRSTQGVLIMNVAENDKVTSLASGVEGSTQQKKEVDQNQQTLDL